MFFEVIRCLKERIRAKKALSRFAFMENVKNLLSSNEGRDFAEVLLQMESVGYDVEWSVIDSAEVVPQHRERVYLVGHLRGTSARQVFPIQRQSESFDRKPKINALYKTHDFNSAVVLGTDGVSMTLTATDYKHPQKTEIKKHNSVKQIGNFVKTKSFGGNPQRGRVYDQKGVSPTLNTMQGGGLQPHILVEQKDDNNDIWYHGKAIRRLKPLECWRLQGFSDEAFYKAKNAGVSNSQLYKQAGNSVTVPVIRAIAEKIVEVSKD